VLFTAFLYSVDTPIFIPLSSTKHSTDASSVELKVIIPFAPFAVACLPPAAIVLKYFN
jgi:hypothetical protein